MKKIVPPSFCTFNFYFFSNIFYTLVILSYLDPFAKAGENFLRNMFSQGNVKGFKIKHIFKGSFFKGKSYSIFD